MFLLIQLDIKQYNVKVQYTTIQYSNIQYLQYSTVGCGLVLDRVVNVIITPVVTRYIMQTALSSECTHCTLNYAHCSHTVHCSLRTAE